MYKSLQQTRRWPRRKQDLIKKARRIREVIPHVSLIPKVILPRLFQTTSSFGYPKILQKTANWVTIMLLTWPAQAAAHARKHHATRVVTSVGELVTMSKNNLRGILSLIWGMVTLTLHLLLTLFTIAAMFLPIIMQISHAVWQSQENIGKKAVLGKSPCASGKAILSKSFSRTRLWSADSIMLL